MGRESTRAHQERLRRWLDDLDRANGDAVENGAPVYLKLPEFKMALVHI